MAKRRNVPESTLTRRQASRARREARMQRAILIGTVITGIAIVGVLVYAYVNEQILVPAKPVATVNGEQITVKQFQDRVKLELYFVTLNIFAQTTDPRVVAQQALDSLIDEALMRQKAKEMGLPAVTDAEVKRRAELQFGYDGGTPEPTSTLAFPTDMPTKDATATVTSTFVYTPSPTATLTANPSLSATPTLTPTESPTVTPTLDLTTTATPTVTLTVTVTPSITPTETPRPTSTPISFEAYSTQSGQIFKNGADLTRLTSDQLRQTWYEKVRSSILSERLIAALKLAPELARDKVHAAHILVASEAEAKAVLDRIAKGETFEKLAAELSTDTSNAYRGGDLGWFGKADMVTAFADAAFSTPPGTISQPVQTQFGWHIIKVYDKAAVPLNSDEKQTSIQQQFTDLVKKWRTEGTVTTIDDWTPYLPTLTAPESTSGAP